MFSTLPSARCRKTFLFHLTDIASALPAMFIHSSPNSHVCRTITDFVGTPGRTRTDTLQILSLVPLPLGYWGATGFLRRLHITLLDGLPTKETHHEAVLNGAEYANCPCTPGMNASNARAMKCEPHDGSGEVIPKESAGANPNRG